MNVLVIPEDFRKDQYILKPIVEAMMAWCGKPHARVEVCKDPLLGGVTNALKWNNLAPIIERYKGMVDLFLLCVDRDGDGNRVNQLTAIELQAQHALPQDCGFFAENAWQELEVWVLAGLDLQGAAPWADIRSETHPKELYYLPYAKVRGVSDEPAEGRKSLATEAAARYQRVRQLCPEDVGRLEAKIQTWV